MTVLDHRWRELGRWFRARGRGLRSSTKMWKHNPNRATLVQIGRDVAQNGPFESALGRFSAPKVAFRQPCGNFWTTGGNSLGRVASNIFANSGILSSITASPETPSLSRSKVGRIRADLTGFGPNPVNQIQTWPRSANSCCNRPSVETCGRRAHFRTNEGPPAHGAGPPMYPTAGEATKMEGARLWNTGAGASTVPAQGAAGARLSR